MNKKILPSVSVIILCLAISAAPVVGAEVPGIFKRYFQDVYPARVGLGPNALSRMAAPGGVLPLPEQAAIELALQSNFDVNLERHSPLVAREDIRRQHAAFDPTARFNFLWDRLTSPTTSILAGGNQITEIRTDYNFGYRKDYQNGAGFEVKADGNRFRTTNAFASLVPAFNTNFEVIVRQQLLQGFGTALGAYRIRIARNNVVISEEEFRRKVTDVVLQAQDRYWELVFAGEDIKVKQESMDLANAILKQNRDRLEVGSAARLEVIQSEAEVAARREELIRSQYTYRRIQDQLVKMISSYQDPREFSGEIQPVSPIQLPAASGNDFKPLFQYAREHRPEVMQAELDINNRRINLESARNQLKPRLDLQASYKQVGLGGTRLIRDFSGGIFNAPIIEIAPGGWGNSLRQLFSADFSGYTLGFNFQVPIFNDEARAEHATALVELNRADMRKLSVEQTVALEVRDALTQLDMNRARLEAAQAAVRSARERLNGEQERFNVGMSTTRDLIEAQRDLTSAESVEVRAKVDLIKSDSVLDKATGATFPKHRIDLKQALAQNLSQ
ncbi:MAG TPA: TolC family protein [Acidobacteriota bacterium]|jgi:outer membrane protein TolC